MYNDTSQVGEEERDKSGNGRGTSENAAGATELEWCAQTAKIVATRELVLNTTPFLSLFRDVPKCYFNENSALCSRSAFLHILKIPQRVLSIFSYVSTNSNIHNQPKSITT